MKEFFARSEAHQQAILSAIDFTTLEQSLLTEIQKQIINEVFSTQRTYTSLKLCDWNYLDDSSLIKILKQSPELKSLDLTRCKSLTGKVIESVAKSCPLLERLSLNETNISYLKVKFSEDSPLKKIQVKDCLQLKKIEITAPQLKHLLADGCAKLTKLQVTAARGAKASLSQCDKLPNQELCYYLNLTSCNLDKFSDDFKSKLKALLSSKTTKTIMPENTLKIEFSGEKLTEDAVKALSIVLYENRSLKILNLYDTGVNNNGLKELSEVIKDHPGLIELNLGYNDFNDTGFEYLTQALKFNNSIRHIKLHYSQISDPGFESLCNILTNKSTVEIIEFNFCKEITQKSFVHLLKALQLNTSLRQINLGGTGMMHDDKSKKLLQRNIVMNRQKNDDVKSEFKESIKRDKMFKEEENDPEVIIKELVQNAM